MTENGQPSRSELYAELAEELSLDIAEVMREEGVEVDEVVDRVLPKGSPGSSYHRPVLTDDLERLLRHGDPLWLITCLQVCREFEWPIGLIEGDDTEEERDAANRGPGRSR